jgi:nitrogen fixation NifU-like protein
MVGAPACGDVMKLQIKVNPATGLIEDARFKTYGCGSAIASSSLVTEWVKGKTLDQALTIKNTADRRGTGAAAGEDPLLDPGRRRHQGGRQDYQAKHGDRPAAEAAGRRAPGITWLSR